MAAGLIGGKGLIVKQLTLIVAALALCMAGQAQPEDLPKWFDGYVKIVRAELGRIDSEILQARTHLARAEAGKIQKSRRQPPVRVITARDGAERIVYNSEEAKAEYIQKIQYDIDGLKRMRADAERGVVHKPQAMRLRNMAIGFIGALGDRIVFETLRGKDYWASVEYAVVQVIDEDEMIIQPRWRHPSYEPLLPLWVSGSSTAGLVDDAKWEPEGVFCITGTKQYQTVAGSVATIFHAERVDNQIGKYETALKTAIEQLDK